jgi:uncharacterized protein YuzE
MVSEELTHINPIITYDEISDVLYISFGQPRPGIAKEIADGDFVRIDPYNDQIVGITIMDFKERYMKSSATNIEDAAQEIIPELLTAIGH